MHQPQTLNDLREICLASPHVLPVGACTKSALASAAEPQVVSIDMRGLTGVISYDPSEFLISVRAGTSIAELVEVLRQHGQYLPFDPVYAARGATVGGSIASGISGSCRLLYGGLRDFMMEVAILDSAGREIRGGGKVVKNAAGFDLPKLVVGSYGRMGIITEATLKVFPAPSGFLTLRYQAGSVARGVASGLRLLALPLPVAALDVEGDGTLWVRLAGPVNSLARIADRASAQLPGLLAERLQPGDTEQAIWRGRAEFDWVGNAPCLVRVATAHHQCAELCALLATWPQPPRVLLAGGGAVAWVACSSVDDLASLDELLGQQKLSGVVINGPGGFRLLGDRHWVALAERIQQAFNQDQRLLAYS